MKYETLIKILFVLLAKRKVSSKYLAKRFNITQRTVWRYVETLSLANIPLYCEHGRNGGIKIVDSFKIPCSFLTEEEFNITVQVLESYANGIKNRNVESVLTKLNALNNVNKDVTISSGNLIIDGSSWGDTQIYTSILEVIDKAFESKTTIEIKYHDRNGSQSIREVEPHKIILKQGLWYVYAYCRERHAFRLFKIGRIEYANLTQNGFEFRQLESQKFDFNKWFKSLDLQEIEFEVEKSVKSDVIEWLGLENVHEIKNGKIFATANLPIDKGLVSKILSFGKGVKVISPENLKTELINTANEILENYK